MSLRGPAFVLSNHVSRPYCVPSLASGAPAAPPGLEPAYLQTQEATDRARIVSLDPLYTRWHLDFLTTPIAIDGVALVNSNISPAGYYRFLATDEQDTYHSFLTLAPATLYNASNVTGVVGNIDEAISSPDSSFIGPTTTTNAWDFGVTFANPSVTPRTGTAMAFVVVVAKLIGSPILAYPKMSWVLAESTLDLGTQSWRAVTESAGTGQVFIFPFNPATLAAPSMVNVESQFVCSAGDNGSYAQIDTIRVYYENAALTSRFDTGWLPRPLSPDATDYDGPQPTVNLDYFLPATVTLGQSGSSPLPRLTVMLLDDQADHDPADASYWVFPNSAGLSLIRRFQDGFVDGGVAVAGPALFLERGVPYASAGPQSPVRVENLGGTSLIGNSYGSDTFRVRTLTIELLATRAELQSLKDRIYFRRGNSGAFYFAAEPDIPIEYRTFNSGWWIVRSFGAESQTPMAYDNGDGSLLYSFVLELEEKL